MDRFRCRLLLLLLLGCLLAANEWEARYLCEQQDTARRRREGHLSRDRVESAAAEEEEQVGKEVFLEFHLLLLRCDALPSTTHRRTGWTDIPMDDTLDSVTVYLLHYYL